MPLAVVDEEGVAEAHGGARRAASRAQVALVERTVRVQRFETVARGNGPPRSFFSDFLLPDIFSVKKAGGKHNNQ